MGERIKELLGINPTFMRHLFRADAPEINRFIGWHRWQRWADVIRSNSRESVEMQQLKNIGVFTEMITHFRPDLAGRPDVGGDAIDRLPVDCGQQSFS